MSYLNFVTGDKARLLDEWNALYSKEEDVLTLARWLLDNNMVGVPGTGRVMARLMAAAVREEASACAVCDELATDPDWEGPLRLHRSLDQMAQLLDEARRAWEDFFAHLRAVEQQRDQLREPWDLCSRCEGRAEVASFGEVAPCPECGGSGKSRVPTNNKDPES